MFEQFVRHVSGKQIYLISSLWIFLVFFVAVSYLLYITKKAHTDRMSELPLEDGSLDPNQTLL